MARSSFPLLRMLSVLLFGDYSFFSEYNFEEYFRSSYRMGRSHFFRALALVFVTLSLFIGLQLVIFRPPNIELILFEIFLVIVFLRLLHFTIYFQFKQHCTMIETLGYFVVNELLIILETSGSLKEATLFIIHGKYSNFSQVFEKALLLSHFGESLETTLKRVITKQLQGNILHLFLNILSIWESGKNLASFSKQHILNQIAEKTVEEVEKIDSWMALSSGLTLLSPPVILCLLLITGLMNYFLGAFLTLGIILTSFLVNPNRHLTLLSKKNQIFLSHDTESIQMLVVLAESMMKGNTFEKSLNTAVNAVTKVGHRNKEKTIDTQTKTFSEFRLGGIQGYDQRTRFLREFLSERAAHLVALAQKFGQIDPYLAGQKLLTITEELNNTSQILNRGEAKRKAADLQSRIIQVLSIISLAIIGGASPFFLYVSTSLSYSFNDFSYFTLDSRFDILFFIIALVMSFLPNRRSLIKTSDAEVRVSMSKIIGCLQVLLFFTIFLAVRTFFLSTYPQV